MEIRFSEYEPTVAATPIFPYSVVASWFGIPATPVDPKVSASMNAISKVVRDYCGRNINKVAIIETFDEIMEPNQIRHLREIPIYTTPTPTVTVDGVTNDLDVRNKTTGRVKLQAGQKVRVAYTGGFDPVPDDLMIAFMELIRMQMAAFGETSFGNAASAASPQEKAVTIGSLKVEYAVSANSDAAKAAMAGGLSADALVPWLSILDQYRTVSAMVST